MELKVIFSGGNSPGLPGYIWGMVGSKAVDLVPVCGGWKKTISRVEEKREGKTNWSGEITLSDSESELVRAE